MKKPSKIIIIYILLAISVCTTVFFFFRTRYLKDQLNTALKGGGITQTGMKENPFIDRFLAINALLADEKFTEAQQAYRKLLDELPTSSILRDAVRLQMTHLDEFNTVRTKLSAYEAADSLKELSSKFPQIDSLAERLSLSERSRGDQLDSMSFALEKANMLAESLKSQLTNKLSSDYLSFSNQDGLKVYYVGNVKGKKANGRGVGLYSDGSRYEGEWKNNMHHGVGAFYWPDGEYYEGNFLFDERQGQGFYYWPNGEKFSGEWKNDKRNGEGTFYGKDGKIVAKGLWQDNKFLKKSK